MERVGKINLKDNINLKDAVLKVIDEIGGFSKFVKTGDVIFLKPNYNTADPSPASTSVDFLKTVVELSYDFGAKLVMIGESSTMTLNTRKILGKAGVFGLLEMKIPPRIYVFEEGEWIKKEISEARYLKKVSVPEILEKADKLILLPCLKTHKYAKFTGALKLSVGFMKPSQRVFLHLNLQEKIAELNRIIHPDLIIMDGRKCFISGGPLRGAVREPGVILASEDKVAIDIEGVKIIQSFKGNSLAGINPEDLPQIANSK
ncbi:MAG: DUF362 domain-containing protein [Spirochaetota bacterium]